MILIFMEKVAESVRYISSNNSLTNLSKSKHKLVFSPELEDLPH